MPDWLESETCQSGPPALALLGCSLDPAKVMESIIDVFATVRETLVSLASYQNKPGIAIGTLAATAVENWDT
jgi:hypothetical protein